MAQQVLLRVYIASVEGTEHVVRAIETGAFNEARFASWFCRVVRNVATDYYHARHGTDGSRIYVPWSQEQEGEVESQEARYRQMLARLDLQRRLNCTELLDCESCTVWLFCFMGFTSGEIARILGERLGREISASTVRTWLKNAIRKLGGSENP
jgi:DNA-directed RNA polymerase specialized sigma24 family protein